MFAKLKNRRIEGGESGNKPLKPYEERTKTYPLSLVITIVNRHQSDFFLDNYGELGASLSVVLYAYSHPPASIMEYLGTDSTKKDIILTVARSEAVPQMLAKAEERFGISEEAKGIAFSLPISGVAGISIYKFLSDQNRTARLMEKGE